jgi:hypothetical protein
MKKISFDNLTKSCFSKLIKLGGLLGISCLVLACIAFQQNKPSTAQEKKDKQAQEKKDEQPTVQKRVPDDLTDNLYLPSFVHECLDKNKGLDGEIDIQGNQSRVVGTRCEKPTTFLASDELGC